MDAQNIIKTINLINPSGFSPKFSMQPENTGLLNKIFDLAGTIKPVRDNGFDITWELWLWSDRGSYEDYAQVYRSYFSTCPLDKLFTPDEKWTVDHKKMKQMWLILFPNETVWFKLFLRYGREQKDMLLSLNNRVIIYSEEPCPKKTDLSDLLEWILDSEEKCIEMIKNGTYSDHISKNLPFMHRSGVVEMAKYWKYVPEDKEKLFGKIDPNELKELESWTDTEESGWDQMTANDYFRICDHLYDLLDLKEKYPIIKGNIDENPVTPKDYYMAYAANYSSVKPFLRLDGDSAEAFDDFVENGYTEHHTWEVCLVPNIHLYPKKINGKFYIILSFDHDDDDYDLIIHLALELRKKGDPILKPFYILKRMEGKQLAAINPHGDNYNWKYADQNKIKTSEEKTLPLEKINTELIKEIQWFPTGSWEMADDTPEEKSSRAQE